MDGQIWERILFVALPYVSLLAFGLTSIYRLRSRAFGRSDLVATLLDREQHRRVVVPLRYGILIVALGHLAAFLVPQSILWWDAHLVRLYILEVLALGFGLLTLASTIGLVAQRFSPSNVRVPTSVMDRLLYVMLGIQVVSGVCVAVFYAWGSAWFASILSPYLWSIVRFSPDLSGVAATPLLVKFHIAFGFVTIGLLPLSRWLHALVVPNSCSRCVTRLLRWPARIQREMTTEG